MEINLEKTITNTEFETTYISDDIHIHAEMIAEFKKNNTGKDIISSSGSLTDNGDSTYTYNITINY